MEIEAPALRVGHEVRLYSIDVTIYIEIPTLDTSFQPALPPGSEYVDIEQARRVSLCFVESINQNEPKTADVSERRLRNRAWLGRPRENQRYWS